MRILSNDVPQADDLDKVVRAVQAVQAGARTYGEIAAALGEVDPRQGRYYRLAGQILGLVSNVKGRNQATLTDAGKEFVAATAEQRKKLLAGAVAGSRLIGRIIPYLESKGNRGASRRELEDFIGTMAQLKPSTIGRRISTVISWLEAIGMLRQRDGRYQLAGPPPNVPIVEYEATDEPLFPRKHDLVTYNQVAERAKKATRYLSVLIDDAARERANDAHRMLTNLVATKIQAAGAIPKRNKYIDLSTVWAESLYFFEMKSTSDTNAHDQVRRAVSQLYEYRYLQEAPSAKLVVVIENPLPDQKKWLMDYVVKDRGLLIAWDGDRNTLHCPPEIREDLGFLA